MFRRNITRHPQTVLGSKLAPVIAHLDSSLRLRTTVG